MRFTLNWLKEYVKFSAPPEEIAEKLTMAGLEVESLERMGKGLEDLIVAEILEIRHHPNASKLALCDVTDGAKKYNIVCGAKNMKAGDRVVLARSGTALPPSAKFPEGMEIKTARIRGELSEGVLCAENEIGISEESEGIMILPQSSEPGSRLIDVLGLNDAVIEVGVTPNRPDCLSVIGIAREVAAISETGVHYPDLSVPEEGENIENLASVEVLDPDGCPRYSCRVITGVEIASSPEWLKARLEASGVRAINNVVDVTNLVLLEFGQPLHAFDYDLIEGGKIVVRAAQEGEIIETLDGTKRSLTGEDLLICNAVKPVAIAGVMGGGDTEISDNTKNILLESAYFNPVRVRRTSKRTNLKSESSYRFERGVDPNGAVKALDRAAELIRTLSGGKVAKGRIDVYPNPVEPKQVKLSIKRLNSVLGADIRAEKIKRIAEGLEFAMEDAGDGDFLFRAPTFRVDITREIDIIEEVARHYGYGKIPPTLPAVSMKTGAPKIEKAARDKVKNILSASGFMEAINYSFEDPEFLSLYAKEEPLRVLNPLTREGAAMRTNLVSGIIRNVALNLNRQNQDVRIFEVGKIYIPSGDGLPREITKIAGAATGRRQPELWDKEEFDFFDMKGILERVFEAFDVARAAQFKTASEIGFLHPGKSAAVLINGEETGFLGELHPEFQERLEIPKRVCLFEIDLEKLVGFIKNTGMKFSPLPKFPSVRRDIALVVDDNVSAGEVVDEIRKLKSPLVEEAGVFDVFKGKSVEEGKKSVAVSLILRAPDKTLTDEEINEVQKRAINKLRSVLGGELRTIGTAQ